MADIEQEQAVPSHNTVVSPTSPPNELEVEYFESLSLSQRYSWIKEKLVPIQGDIRSYVAEAKRLARISIDARLMVIHVGHCYFDDIKRKKDAAATALIYASETVVGQKLITGRSMNDCHCGRISAKAYLNAQALEDKAEAKVTMLEESLTGLKDREREMALLLVRLMVQHGLSLSKTESYLRAPAPKFDVGY